MDFNKEELKNYCLEQGADLFGFADISQEKKSFNLPEELTSDLNRAVSLAVSISRAVLTDIKDAPTKLYFHHYRTTNVFLDQLALKVCHWLQRQAAKAVPIPASQILDWQKQTAHLSHKRIAYLAGLGWIGRNNLLVNEKLGANFRLVTILTDCGFEADKPREFDCGPCRKCLEACPVSAIKEKPGDFDHLACFEKLKEFQKNRIVDQFICGVCVKNCLPKERDHDK